MSIYRRGETWWFYFRHKGRRFRKSTFTTDKALAERIEARARLEAAEQSSFPKKQEMKLGEAMLKYWTEHAKHLPAQYTIAKQLKKLEALGVERNLSEINDREVSDYVARRRGQKARNKETLISPSSVNGELRTLRAMTKRAHENWGAAVGVVTWKNHMLDESSDRRRYLTAPEQETLLSAIRPDLRAIAEFCLLTGARFAKAQNLTWADVDYRAGKIAFRNMKGKRKGQTHTIPISTPVLAILANERGHHPIYVFTYECQENRPAKCNGTVRIKGERYQFSRDGWRRVWKRALKDADLSDFRFHDTRHTALSRITGKAGLAVAGKLAGHKDLKTTLRYSHVLDDDVLNAMENVHKSGHSKPATGRKTMKRNVN